MNCYSDDKHRKLGGWYLLSEWRNELFGLAILSIIIHHACLDCYSQYNGINIIIKTYRQIIGSLGVEIFVFMSAMGLYFSIKKNHDIKTFYKRRMMRILPAYLIVSSITFFISDLCINQGNILTFLEDISFVSLITNGMILYWYIAFILVMYLLYPLIFKLLEDKHDNRFVFPCLLLFSFAFVIVILHVTPTVGGNLYLALTRIPIFLLGAYYSKKIYERDNFSVTDILVMLFGVLLRFLYWLSVLKLMNLYKADYVNIVGKTFSTAPLMLVTIWIISHLSHENIVNKVLRWFGKISLELYIVHVSARLLFSYIGLGSYDLISGSGKYTFGAFAFLIVCSIIISVILHKLIGKLAGERSHL